MGEGDGGWEGDVGIGEGWEGDVGIGEGWEGGRVMWG